MNEVVSYPDRFHGGLMTFKFYPEYRRPLDNSIKISVISDAIKIVIRLSKLDRTASRRVFIPKRLNTITEE